MSEISREKLYKEIGGRIKRARDAHEPKLSQAQLAERLGIERTSITNIESGAQRATIHLIYSIAQRLDLPLEKLLPAIDDQLILDSDRYIEIASLKLGDRTRQVPTHVKNFIDKMYDK